MSFFKKFTDSVSKGVSTATEKAQQTVEVTRLNAQISGKRKEIDKLFSRIGESVYEAYQQKDLSLAEDQVIPSCEEITSIYEEINVIDGRIKAIRNEKECVCGKRVPYDTRFCPSCGHPFPEPEPVVEEVLDYRTEEAESEAPHTGMDVDKSMVEDVNPELQENEDRAPAPIIDQRQICNSCGTPLYADSHFCPTCGQATRG